MGTIAIVANSSSGKDIRRLVTHATVIDNQEKINILRRIVAGILSKGSHEIHLMPDRSNLAYLAVEGQSGWQPHVHITDMPVYDSLRDTLHFVGQAVEQLGADVVIVLGGDGTSRAAAKVVADVPMISVSTGTNNVYPALLEGTAVGLAAGALAGGVVQADDCAPRAKRIELQLPGPKEDIALIDCVISTCNYIGAKALIHQQEIHTVVATQCHPANIGFSALAGSVEIVAPGQQHGLMLELDWQSPDRFAPISAGTLARFGVTHCRQLPVGERLRYLMPFAGSVGLDGEREHVLRQGDEIQLCITRNGPKKVDVHRAIELAAAAGYFRLDEAHAAP